MGLTSECAPRPIPAMHFATWTKNVHVENENVDFILFFSQVGCEGPDGVTLRVCAPSHSCHAFCDVDDKTSMLKTKSVDFILFFHR